MADESKIYFTADHEEAIVEYCKEDCTQDRKNELYNTIIGPVFDELINKIVYTYKFNELPNFESLIEECKVWVVTILPMFNQSRGSKAFSYFSVSTKNWFIQKYKRRKLELQREVNYEMLSEFKHNEELIELNQYEIIRESSEFTSSFKKELESWDKDRARQFLGANDIKVLEAIKILFSSIDDIQIFNKKAIFLYLREITGLSTKQISRSIKKLRKRYVSFRTDWNNGDI
jgi:hypothetical protein